ncbi:isovaleryl-CoA dehydrogenase [Polycyclovorans algicola]|uniref:isovaleryl-CoA dehydrogenase n=1 Tax=Polycyclovorans algicola TaxID=616992 RepID=UPI0004A767FF|nr:isovaleryl-CoA dehydrogenase [Polycyclovorans algicola]
MTATTFPSFDTHQVSNQPSVLEGFNAFDTDPMLQAAVRHYGADWARPALSAYGAVAGSELLEQGRIANENPPRLKAFDRFGHRIDEVEFHPAYHRCMTLAMKHGLHAFAWWHADQPSAHVARSAITYQHAQFEAGTGCPLTMTYAAIPALRHSPELAKVWVPRLTSKVYDPRMLPASQKHGCTIGMGMTEKQGGSDVRSNTTTATAQADGHYTLIGHKWFFSAPMCDAWLVLAQAPAGITCFLLPKMLEDGTRNRIHIQRLKDKLGDRSNASSEVEFHNAVGLRVGEEGRGVRTILEMVALTRLDCMVASAGLMRQATVQAIHHCRQRSAFGKPLITQPLMQNVLHDLVLENDGHLALAMRVAQAVDQGPNDPAQAAFARIATAIGKYWICRRAPSVVNEAQECLGGAGYVEETLLPRLYRQAPLNSIWEGSGNVQCLDVLRALSREPDTREALFGELLAMQGADPDLDRELAALPRLFDDVATLEVRSRQIVERVALALEAACLLRMNHPNATAFIRSRIAREHGLALGTLPAEWVDVGAVEASFLG